MRVCYVCLARDAECRLFGIKTLHLLEAYEWLSGADSALCEDALICSRCATLLKRCVNLRNMCLSSYKLLKCAEVTDEILDDKRSEYKMTPTLMPAIEETLFYQEIKEKENFKTVIKAIHTDCTFYKLNVNIAEVNSTDETKLKTEIKSEMFSDSEDLFSETENSIDTNEDLEIIAIEDQELINCEFDGDDVSKPGMGNSQLKLEPDTLESNLEFEIEVNIENDRLTGSSECPDWSDKKNDETVTNNQPVKKPTSTKQYKCNVCNKIFTHRGTFNRHTGVHNGERPFSCSLCNKMFKQKTYLTSHMRIHTGEKKEKNCKNNQLIEKPKTQYECNVCDKLFTHKGTFDKHKRVHTGERPFMCPVCNKGFSQKNCVTSHMRTHTGERPYKCHICTMAFAHHCSLKTHINTHTGMKPYSCHICEKCFTDRSSLLKHLKRHKGITPGGRSKLVPGPQGKQVRGHLV